MGCTCGKTIFQALKKCFFRTALLTRREAQLCKKTMLQALKKCFSTLLLWNSEKLGFAKKTDSKNCFLRTNLMKFRQAWLCKKQSFRLYFFSALLSSNSDKPGFPKNNFSCSTKLFFRHCSHETQTSPAFQKTIFQALKNHFFANLLSNLPTPPRYLV